MYTRSSWTARVLAGSAVVALAACTDSTTTPTQPQFQVARGHSQSTWTCTKAGSPKYNHVGAERKQELLADGYTCTKN
jgi:hypothetical protein